MRENIDPLKAIQMEAWELVLIEYFDEQNGTSYGKTIRAYCDEYNHVHGWLEKK